MTAAISINVEKRDNVFIAIGHSDRAQIFDAITAIATGADRHDWQRMRAAFADVVTTDYTSLWSEERTTQRAADLITQWARFLPGFEVTQHLVTNHTITGFEKDTATAQADFQATYRIAKDYWVVGGMYDFELLQFEDRWVVSSMTMKATWEAGNRALIAKADMRAKTTK